MNKADLLDALEDRLGSRKAASDAVEALVDVVIREVAKGGKVGITGFGTFERAARAARTGRNPRTGESVRIKKTNVPKFRPGTQFKDVVSDPKKLPKAGVAGARANSASALGATTTAAPATKATAKKATTVVRTANPATVPRGGRGWLPAWGRQRGQDADARRGGATDRGAPSSGCPVPEVATSSGRPSWRRSGPRGAGSRPWRRRSSWPCSWQPCW